MCHKFVASYSGGKDSVLAIHRAMEKGMVPIGLIITFRADRGRSWFHGIPKAVLEKVSQSLKIPIHLMITGPDDYAQNMEKMLRQAKEWGAEACVFGDIDLEEHRTWCRERCESAGISAEFPLWGESRQKLVYELIDAGFCADITTVNTTRLGEEFLGRRLTRDVAESIAMAGADICGENGEYHTFVSDGPIFTKKVAFTLGEKILDGAYAFLSILDT